MKPLPTYEPHMLIEMGRLLKLARDQQDFSVQEMCNKLGVRAEQIHAIESGSAAYFPNNAQPFIWFARLYARKLGVDLPVLVYNPSQGTKRTISCEAPVMPAFLIPPKSASQDN
jgi:cytoskeletal protein RodZ